ncbi:MAG: beta-lactamase family protein [Myxococcales bacterium]|nr:beta-lactamase family protein [Myxococcales bacterium]
MRTRTLAVLVSVTAACGGGSPKTPAGPTPPATDGADAAVVDPQPANAPPVAARTLTAEEKLTSASGATFEVAAGWSVAEAGGVVTLTEPEGELTMSYVEVEAAASRAAIAAAWQRVRPGFALAEAEAEDAPARDGWDGATQIVYVTPAAEQRVVIAIAFGKGSTWRVWLLDGAQAALGRRGAQLGTAVGSLTAPGVARESWVGRPARPLDAARLAELDAFVEEALRTADAPGAAVAIVEGGKVIHERGYGVRELGKPAKVGPHTLFLTGSTGKSLTTLLMARAVDAGRFGWDTPLTTVLPTFALGSPEVTQAMQVRHTACACTGMPRQDLEMLFEYAGVTAEQRLASLATMVPTTKFGETFQYSNLLVMTGGYAAGHAFFPKLGLGAAYDKAMAAQVFAPLGMKDTTYDFKRAAKADHATPHARDAAGAIIAVPLATEAWAPTVRPAGGQWSSVHDYTRVLLLELGRGVVDGKRVVSEANLLARRAPQVKIDDERAYGLGLVVGTTAGVPIVEHDGGTAGFTTSYFWLPEHGVGAVVVVNAGESPLPDAVARRIRELVFDATPRAATDLAEGVARRRAAIAEEVARLAPTPDPAWLAPLLGAWTAPGLGRIEVRRDAGALVVDAGEWTVRAAERTAPDGTHMLVTTGAPFAGLELVPEDRDGARVLVVHDQQHAYVFTRATK